MSNATQRPVEVVNAGRIRVRIWKNDTTVGPKYSAQIRRVYRLPEKQRQPSDKGFRETDSLSRDELLLAAQALQEAFWRFVELESSNKSIDESAPAVLDPLNTPNANNRSEEASHG